MSADRLAAAAVTSAPLEALPPSSVFLFSAAILAGPVVVQDDHGGGHSRVRHVRRRSRILPIGHHRHFRRQVQVLSDRPYIERWASDVACRPDLPEERERICIADSRLRAFIELGERISGHAGGWAQADHDRLGVISWILIMTLFVVRASTMGALKDANDVWFEENTEWPTRDGTTRRTRSLCFRVRFLKHWRGGR